MTRVIHVFAIFLLTLAVNAAAAHAVTSFDDIEFWVGSGANRAAVAIDWFENSAADESLVWGYRWDGAATGQDMLLAVVAADPRLFIKLEDFGGNLGNAVYGIGYDDGDGEFALDDNTVFDEAGIAGSPGPADGAESVDADDFYGEGWFTAFWHYGNSDGNPYDGGAWESAQFGMTGRNLSDGDWDSWAFTPSFDFTAFAENPVAAPSPFPAGDFDRDGAVTAADYDVWKTAFGSTTELAADASGNGVVDAADYTIWRDRFSGGASLDSMSVPEPSSLVAVVGALLLIIVHTVRARRLAF